MLLARFVAGLRVVAAWAAGIARMPWGRFMLWNAVGGVAWATAVGLAAYVFGNAAVAAFERYGLIAALVVVAAGALALVGMRRLGHRAARDTTS